MTTLRLRPLTWLPIVALAGACGTETPEDLGSVHVKSQLISAAAGGELSVTATDYAPFAGVKVQIPAGALAQDTKITVDVAAASIMDGDATSAGPAVDLGPSGTTFSKPVTVRVPVTGAVDMELVRVYVRHGDGTREVILPASLTYDAQAGVLQFTVEHFTTYEPGRAHDGCRHVTCPSGQCSNGQCVPPAGACTEQECAPAPGAPNYTCSDGTIGGPFCERDAAGTGGWVFVTCPVACQADSDCGAGEACINGTCAVSTVVTCGNATCPSGEVCCNASCGICTPPGGACTQQACVASCSSDADCAPGESCDPATGTCGPSAPVGCTMDAECGAGQYCCNPLCGTCVPLGTSCVQGCVACASDADCGPATHCDGGICRY